MLAGRADAKEQMEEETQRLVKKSRRVTAAWASPPSEARVHRHDGVSGAGGAGVGRAALVPSVPVRGMLVASCSLPAPGEQEVGREEVRAAPQRAKGFCKV